MLVVPKMFQTSTALHLCMRQPLKVRQKAILFWKALYDDHFLGTLTKVTPNLSQCTEVPNELL